MKKKDLAFNAVMFDMDNVLVDTRKSYLEAIRWTVEIYLTEGNVPLFSPNLPSEPGLLTAQDVENFKLLGGFNDDWDCCYGLLTYLLSLPVKKRTMKDLLKAKNIPKFSKTVEKYPLRVSGIVSMLGRNSAVKIEKIRRIFQEIYLGKELFKVSEGKIANYWNKRGLIHSERLIFKRSVLERIKAEGVSLGIATGRSRLEAIYAIKHFGILDLFDALTPMNEVKKEEEKQKKSLRKPHPFSLLKTAEKIGGDDGRFLYVGDLPDDVLATNSAKKNITIESVGFLAMAKKSKPTLKAMQAAEPDHIIYRASDLIHIVKRGKAPSS